MQGGNRFGIVLRQCHALITDGNLQNILIKLIASKEEAEVAKVIQRWGVGEILVLEGHWSRPIELRGHEYSHQAALAALYVVCKVLINLGYFLGLSKCVLSPSTRLTFLGMAIDTSSLAFLVAKEKREAIPWIQECHVSMSLSTDASAFRWAAVFHQHPTDLSVGDYWEDSLMNEHINVKEMHAVLKALECLPASVRDCRLDIQVDNLATLHAWQGRGPRSLKLK
ncbi:hypothetical protein OS493_029018 [Desmophyllum pertusum]|uniref:RNase H type-1 domain-containing protein n=1 Tax=Desmophyllum pertusum TaxID=174260 RepID=A0A9X0CIY7_9CNID|nr:hypothetical protein OS493_029018 [Desmophyllum pertusum]